MSDKVLNERIDDLIPLSGYASSSRADVIRCAVFALPTDDEEHLRTLLRYGRLRYREASGLNASDQALDDCIEFLGWWNEDAERAALLSQLEDIRRRLVVCASRGEAIADYARGGEYKFA